MRSGLKTSLIEHFYFYTTIFLIIHAVKFRYILWEGHKIWKRNLPIMFKITYKRKKRWQIFFQNYMAFSDYLNIIYSRENSPANLGAQRIITLQNWFHSIEETFCGQLVHRSRSAVSLEWHKTIDRWRKIHYHYSQKPREMNGLNKTLCGHHPFSARFFKIRVPKVIDF